MEQKKNTDTRKTVRTVTSNDFLTTPTGKPVGF